MIKAFSQPTRVKTAPLSHLDWSPHDEPQNGAPEAGEVNFNRSTGHLLVVLWCFLTAISLIAWKYWQLRAKQPVLPNIHTMCMQNKPAICKYCTSHCTCPMTRFNVFVTLNCSVNLDNIHSEDADFICFALSRACDGYRRNVLLMFPLWFKNVTSEWSSIMLFIVFMVIFIKHLSVNIFFSFHPPFSKSSPKH